MISFSITVLLCDTVHVCVLYQGKSGAYKVHPSVSWRAATEWWYTSSVVLINMTCLLEHT